MRQTFARRVTLGRTNRDGEVIMLPVGAEEAVTVHIDSATSAELDALANAVSRDRSFIIHQAIEAYLATHRWQVGHIAEGLRQADSGVFARDDEVAAAYARWR